MSAILLGCTPYPFHQCLQDGWPPNDLAQTDMASAIADGKQAVEGSTEVPSTIPPEDKFLEVNVKVPSADTVVDAHHPPLHQREHAVNSLEPDMGRHVLHNLRLMNAARYALIRRVAIGEDRGRGQSVLEDERMQRFSAVATDRFQPNTTRSPVLPPFHCTNDIELADGTASLSSADWLVLGTEGYAALVYFHDRVGATQWITFGIDHRSAELMEKQPGGLVGADPELCLKLQRRNAVRVCGNQVGSQEPLPERQVRLVHDRARDDRGLFSARRQLAMFIGSITTALPEPWPGP